jgi:nitrile hydratase accessory protein
VIERDADEPFTAPWQARAFAMAVVAAERMGVDWDEFRDRLKAAIAERPDQPYYESWLDALESLLLAREVVTREEVTRRAEEYAALERDPVF